MLGVLLPKIAWAVASLAHSSGTRQLLHPGPRSPAPPFFGIMRDAHPAAHSLADHSFVISQIYTGNPDFCPSAGHMSFKAVTPVAEPPSARHQAIVLAPVSCGSLSQRGRSLFLVQTVRIVA